MLEPSRSSPPVAVVSRCRNPFQDPTVVLKRRAYSSAQQFKLRQSLLAITTHRLSLQFNCRKPMRSQKIDRNCTAKRKHGSGPRPLKIRTCMTAAPKATFRRDRNAGETLHHHTNRTKGRLEPKVKHRPRKKMNRGSLTAPARPPETGGSETISRFDGDFAERGWKKGFCKLLVLSKNKRT